jgi:hypothetical protein
LAEESAMPYNSFVGAPVLLATLATVALALAAFRMQDPTTPDQHMSRQVMLILRGIANAENPRGQLDDDSALEYARRLGFEGEVLDVAGNARANSPQVIMALDRIRSDGAVTAIYGFSGGGYSARLIWKELSAAERARIRKVIVIGSPQITEADFLGSSDVLILPDPPEGHLAGPKVLLESVEP